MSTPRRGGSCGASPAPSVGPRSGRHGAAGVAFEDFFAELEHVLGLRELPETPEEHAVRKAVEAEEQARARRQHPSWANAPNGPPREWVQTYKPGRRWGGDGDA